MVLWRQVLWRRDGGNVATISVNVGGLVTEACRRGELIDITQPHQDERFNKDVDMPAGSKCGGQACA